MKEGLITLSQKHNSEYQEQLYLKMLLHYEMQKSRLVALDSSISKLYLLNLDSLLPIIKPLYSL